MKQHKQLMKIAFTGLMAALSYVVFTFLQIKTNKTSPESKTKGEPRGDLL